MCARIYLWRSKNSLSEGVSPSTKQVLRVKPSYQVWGKHTEILLPLLLTARMKGVCYHIQFFLKFIYFIYTSGVFVCFLKTRSQALISARERQSLADL